MLSKLLNEIIILTQNLTTWTECREYEGELDSEEDSVLMPPSALVEIEGDDNDEENDLDEGVNLRIIVVAMRMTGIQDSTGALDLVDILKSGLHDQYLPISGFDIHYKSFSLIGNLPGLKMYETRFKATK